MRTARIFALLPILAACARPETAAPDGGAPSRASWSRDAMSPPDDREPRSGKTAAASVDVVDRAALDELLAAAPRPEPTLGPSSALTKIGTSTGVPAPKESARPAAARPEAPRPQLEVGAVGMHGETADVAIEKAARAQLYWELVQRCRDPEGKLLPHDVIRLSFNVDPDGYLVIPSIVASAVDPRYDEAAACMRRELSAASFRAPAGTRGLLTRVAATVPSVD